MMCLKLVCIVLHYCLIRLFAGNISSSCWVSEYQHKYSQLKYKMKIKEQK